MSIEHRSVVLGSGDAPADVRAGELADGGAELCHCTVVLRAAIQTHVYVGQALIHGQGLAVWRHEGPCPQITSDTFKIRSVGKIIEGISIVFRVRANSRHVVLGRAKFIGGHLNG